MPVTSDHDDLEADLLDDDDGALEVEGEGDAQPVEGEAKPGAMAFVRSRSKGERAVAVIVAVVAFMWVLGKCGGDDKPKAAAPAAVTPAATVPVDDILVGLPTLAPAVYASVPVDGWQQFANEVASARADGTSICDVWFGYVRRTVKQDGRNVDEVAWAITTPAMQARSGVGVKLPSSRFPVRAFYGAPCNVVEADVLLVPAPTTTAKPAS